MPSGSGSQRKTHKNDEKTVRCPVEGCDKETLSRGLHLHVLQSTSDGHGTQGEIPSDVDLDGAEVVGKREVEMEYPEERESETVARLCPYCERPHRGKHGVMIHLGQMAGRKNHPENPTEIHEPEEFPVVHLDEDENIIEIVEEGTTMPSTDRRRQREEDGEALDARRVRQYIQELREQGRDEEAERANAMLLG